jgi:preprotein translocase subunit SecD
MERSLKWRTLALIVATLLCVAILAPSFVDRDRLPSWFTWGFHKRISLGLDLQGGKHIVFNIALDKAVDDKSSEIKRDLESMFIDENYPATVKTPRTLLGAVTVNLPDETKRAEYDSKIDKMFGKDIESRKCGKDDGEHAICFKVSSSYADSIKKNALTNAVATIRERINEKGLAEPSVVEKGDDIIVELPGDPKSQEMQEAEELIRRTAKLEMKIVDDCGGKPQHGCTAKHPDHSGSDYMRALFKYVGYVQYGANKGDATEPEAARLGIKAGVDQWHPEEGGGPHSDPYLVAYDRKERMPEKCAKKKGKLTQGQKPDKDGTVEVNMTGREIIERYINGESAAECPAYQGVAQKPNSNLKVPDDHEIGYEPTDPDPDSGKKETMWRTYYLERAVRLTGSAISNAFPQYDQNTNRPIVILNFTRFGGKVFGDVTSQIVGMKFATILDGKVRSAPVINQAIRGGSASITLGGGDVERQEKEQKDLVAVLKTGSLPAPLEKASESDVGPTLGRDAIAKTRLSFIIGILLVIAIMVGVYKWSGWIAVFAVVFHIIMTLAVMALFGATLTLPGIAAIVLSIGMEVDGNILIYERIRDELNLGKSVRGAIDLGFSRAFSAILDGQLTTAAAGWVLLQYGSGPIKGFAVMLLVGVFTTLTTNIWVTRILFDWNVVRKKGQIQTISI